MAVSLLAALATAGALAAFTATGGSSPVVGEARSAPLGSGTDGLGSSPRTTAPADAPPPVDRSTTALPGPDDGGSVAGPPVDGPTGDGAAGDRPTGLGAAGDRPTVAGSAIGAGAGDAALAVRPRPIAQLDGLTLLAPSSAVVVVGFHEASTSHALPLSPRGTLTDNHNPTRYVAAAPGADADAVADGIEHVIMASRGRRAGPTSAIDVVLRDDERVLSPVTGTVSDVRVYHLSGRHEDVRVEVVPDAAPHLRVVLVHLDGIRVGVGDRVTAGVAELARTARRFPFTSQIDRETEPDRWPHVHLEVQPIDAPRPGDNLEDDEDGEHVRPGDGRAGREADREGARAEAAAG